MTRHSILVSLSALLSILSTLTAQPRPERRFEVNDLFEMEGVGFILRRSLLVSSRRTRPGVHPLAAEEDAGQSPLETYAGQRDRRRVGTVRRQTAGQSHERSGRRFGLVCPQWSPDGQKLAMLSTRGGDMRVWVLDLKTRQLRPLSPRSIAIADVHERPFVWVDSERVLYPVLPEGERPIVMMIDQQSQEIASAAWQKTVRGKETTASVLDSGPGVRRADIPQGRLAALGHTERNWQDVVARGRSVDTSFPGQEVRRGHATGLGVCAARGRGRQSASSASTTVKVAALDGSAIAVEGRHEPGRGRRVAPLVARRQ